MNGIAIKDIKGALVEQIIKPLNGDKKHDEYVMKIDFFNQAISQQGQVKIGINREKLAEIINAARPSPFNVLPSIHCYELSDSIIAKEHELIEVVK